MKPQEFCYWLQGFFELSGATSLDASQTMIVKNHLNLVFAHAIDPATPGDAAHLQAIHDGQAPVDPAEPAWNHETLPGGIIARC